MPTTPAATARPPVLFVALVLVAATALTFAPGLDNPYIGVEARAAIRDNPQLASIGASFTNPSPLLVSTHAPNLVLRPSSSASYALNFALCGATPRCLQAGNLLLHLGAGLLLFVLLQRWLALPHWPQDQRRRALPLATLIAAVWLLHPLQTEVVAYLPGRAEGLAGTLVLAALVALVYADERQSRLASALGLVAALGAAGSDVSGTLVLPVALAFATQRHAITATAALRRRPLLNVGLGLAALLGLGLAVLRGEASGIAPWIHWAAQPAAWLRHVHLFFWPATLQLDAGLAAPTLWWQSATAVVAFGVAGLLWGRAFRDSPLRSAVAITALGLAPYAFLPAPLAFAERHAYLARIGLAAVVVLLADQLRCSIASAPWRRTLTYVATSAIAVALVLRTQARIADYHDEIGPIAPAARAAARAKHLAYLRDNPAAAMRERDEIIAAGTEPDAGLIAVLRDTYLQLARQHVDAGDEDAALPHLRRALELAPERVDVHYDLGRILAHGADPAQAEAHLQAAVALDPEHADAHLCLGELLARRGDVLTAREHFAVVRELAARTLDRHPASIEAWCQLGRARRGLDQPERALEAFAEALALDPRHPETLRARVATLRDLGRIEDSQHALDQARRILPHDAELERWATSAGAL